MKNCSEVKRMMSLYLDNELSEQIRNAFEQHIYNCKSCKQELKEMNMIMMACREIEEEELPEEFNQLLHEKLAGLKQDEEKGKQFVLLRNRYFKVLSTLAACLVLAFFMKGFLQTAYINGNIKSESTEDKLQVSASVKNAEDSELQDNTQEPEVMYGTIKPENNLSENKQLNKASSVVREPVTEAKKDIATYTKAKMSEHKEMYDGAYQNENSTTQVTASPITPPDDKVKNSRAAEENRGMAVVDLDTFADAGRQIDLVIKTDNPETVVEQVEAYAQSSDAFVFPESDESTMVLTQALTLHDDKDKTDDETADQNNESKSFQVRLKIEDSKYDEFLNTLKSGINPSEIELGVFNIINITDKLNDMNTRLDEIKEKINGMESKENVSDDENLEMLKDEANELQKQIDGIKEDENFTFITVLITEE